MFNVSCSLYLKFVCWYLLKVWILCTLLKVENNSPWVNFINFLEKMKLLSLELIFISSCWWVYINIKFYIQNERIEWYKKLSLFAYRAQNNLNALATTLLKWKNDNNSTWVTFNWFIAKKMNHLKFKYFESFILRAHI